jgi:hypothetical protein
VSLLCKVCTITVGVLHRNIRTPYDVAWESFRHPQPNSVKRDDTMNSSSGMYEDFISQLAEQNVSLLWKVSTITLSVPCVQGGRLKTSVCVTVPKQNKLINIPSLFRVGAAEMSALHRELSSQNQAYLLHVPGPTAVDNEVVH